MIIDIMRRPRKCPKCGGMVCDILYGDPTSTWEEDYLSQTGHPAVLGGCIVHDGMPEYECKACGLLLRKLSFPSNPSRLAKLAFNEEWFDGLEYVGIYRKKAVYRPKVKEGYCCDALVLVFVDQKGKVSKKIGIDIMEIIDRITFGKGKGIMIR